MASLRLHGIVSGKFSAHSLHRTASSTAPCQRPVCSARGKEYFPQERAVSFGRRAILECIVISPIALASSTFAARASGSGVPPNAGTMKNLSPEEIKDIVMRDLVERQFLATANFSPEIYSPNCTFTDEIDSYDYASFVKGTQALFDASESTVQLVGDIEASESQVILRFREELAFNVPFKPKTTLSGQLILRRDAEGLISSYREIWDQSVPDVLRTVHFTKQF